MKYSCPIHECMKTVGASVNIFVHEKCEIIGFPFDTHNERSVRERDPGILPTSRCRVADPAVHLGTDNSERICARTNLNHPLFG